ncbi:MAG: hypothetical protein HN790_05505 [Methylococcales bacterium]|jgi:hypothetical protein|nr:hypothetical protein [Methylococcales bacterium]
MIGTDVKITEKDLPMWLINGLVSEIQLNYITYQTNGWFEISIFSSENPEPRVLENSRGQRRQFKKFETAKSFIHKYYPTKQLKLNFTEV